MRKKEKFYILDDANEWERVGYDQALCIQRELTLQGEYGWLLFSPRPTITLGHRAAESDLRADAAFLQTQGIDVLRVDRGGLVTYHGPGQLVLFPLGTLEQHVASTRGVKQFVEQALGWLETFVQAEWTSAVAEKNKRRLRARASERCPTGCESTAGLWSANDEKICSVGIKFAREGLGHGFSLNLTPTVRRGFEWIHPCGQIGGKITSLYLENELDRDAQQRTLMLERLIQAQQRI